MPTCATCANYSRPGEWSAHCRLGPPEWMEPRHNHPAYSIVRADNRCTKHSAAVEGKLAA